MHAGDVQGPINREPEEKLDPSLKNQAASSSSSTSGIRRLYVVDSNNLIVVVIDSYFISSFTTTTTTHTTTDTNVTTNPSPTTTIETSPPEIEPSQNSSLLPRGANHDYSPSVFLLVSLFLFNLVYFLIVFCLDLSCLPRLALATGVFFLHDSKPSMFLFVSSVLFLINDKCAKLLRPRLGGTTTGVGPGLTGGRLPLKTRRRSSSSLFIKSTSKRSRLKDNGINISLDLPC